jgi:hypothetical protein
MKFFCMDLHISVIADFKSACPDVEVVDWCLSGHAHVMKRQRDYPKHINPDTWQDLTWERIRLFREEYDSFLRQFDGFIVAHAAAFAMIYEPYDKPILMINSVRYDLPFCWSRNAAMLDEYHACLRRLHAKGLLTIVSNNKADQEYTHTGLGIRPEYNPSLCLYAGIRYAPTRDTFLCYMGSAPNHRLIEKRPSHFEWSDIGAYKGIIAFPYEASVMSLFEHFSGGMPLFFPTARYMKETVSMQCVSAYWGDHLPGYLSAFLGKDKWLELADMYDVFQSPNTHYFDSLPELIHQLETFEYVDDTEFRQAHIKQVQLQWRSIVERIVSGKFLTQHPRHLSYNRLPLLANVVIDANYHGEVVPQHTYPYREPYSAGDVLFVKTDFLGLFLEKPLRVPITLVTGVSDLSPTNDQIQSILDNSNIRRWIGVNIPVTHPKITKVLIGVGEAERKNGKHDVLVKLHAERPRWDDKQDALCVPYHRHTHTSRILAPTLPELPFEDYMREIGKYKFVVNMRGNGLDTHRFCEILLMGSVPVVEHSGLDDLYSQFPCVIVDSFSNIDISSFVWDASKYEAFLDMFWLRKKI